MFSSKSRSQSFTERVSVDGLSTFHVRLCPPDPPLERDNCKTIDPETVLNKTSISSWIPLVPYTVQLTQGIRELFKEILCPHTDSTGTPLDLVSEVIKRKRRSWTYSSPACYSVLVICKVLSFSIVKHRTGVHV